MTPYQEWQLAYYGDILPEDNSYPFKINTEEEAQEDDERREENWYENQQEEL